MTDEIKGMSSAAGSSGGYILNEKGAHDGMMIAFLIPAKTGEALLSLAQEAGLPGDVLQPLDGLHLTLTLLSAYDSDADLSVENSLNLASLEAFAQGWGALSGVIGGIGRFQNNPEQDVIYASFDSPALPGFRQALIEYLQSVGINPILNHGFTPHITLAYISKDVLTPTIPLEPISVTFDGLSLVVDKVHYDVPFRKDSAVPEAEQIEVEADKSAVTPVLTDEDPGAESYTNEVDEELSPTQGTAFVDADKGGDEDYAYPEGEALPMPDAQHVILAAAALGPNPPHGHQADIPSDKLGKVKGRIRARAKALGMGQEDVARVNAYLSGHAPSEKMSKKDVASWSDLFEQVLSQTGDENKAALAAQGAINRRAILGVKAASGDLPTTIRGWAMIFSDPDNLDLQGTYFDQMTRTLVDYYPRAPLWMEHGRDERYGSPPVGHRTVAQVFPYGIWLEHDLHTDHPLYARTAQDADDGLLFYSSDSLAHYAAQGFDPGDGYLGEWPLAGCSLTYTPAEPGLGPVQARNLELALKSAAQKREATGAQNEASASQEKEETTMDPTIIPTEPVAEEAPGDFVEPTTDVETVPGTALDALAQMYGCDSNPDAVRAAMDSHIAQMQTEGRAHPDLCKTLGLPEDSQPVTVADHLNTLYSSAMSVKEEAAPPDAPPAAMAVRHDYGALHRHLHSGDGAAKSQGPYMTGTIAQKGINVNKGLPVPGVIDLVTDMIRMKGGLAPKHAFNSAKAMTSATGPTGGYILRQEISENILDPLRANPIVFKLGAQEEDMQGMQVKQVPAMQSAPAGNWIGENVAVTNTQPSYRMLTLVPHGYQVTVPIPVNVEANMTPRAEKQLRDQIILTQTLAIDYAAMLGTGGGGQPVGILNTPNVRQMLLATNGRVPTFADIVSADGLLDDSNVPQDGARRGMAFHSKIKRAFTGQTDSDGRPLLRESWATGAAKTIADYPYEVSTQIPTNITVGSATTASYVFFADWRFLIVGLSDVVELRLSETYMQNLQVGLLAYIYADIKVAYPEAFIAMTGALGADVSGVTVTTNTLG